MSIRARSYATAVAAALIVCAVSGITIYTERGLQQSLVRMESESIPLIDALHTLRFAALRMVSSTNEYALVQMERRHTPDPSRPPSVPDTDEVALRNAAAVSFSDTLQSFEELVKRAQPDRQELAAHIGLSGGELTAASEEVLKQVTSGGDAATVLASKERLEAAEQDLLKMLDGLLSYYADTVPKQSVAARLALRNQARVSLLALILAAAVVSLLIAGQGRSISGDLTRLHAAAEAVARGTTDQVRDVSRLDEIGHLAATVDLMAGEVRKSNRERAVADAILASLPDALLVTDGKLLITRANPPALKLLGATDPMQVLGRKLTEISVDVAAPAQRVQSTRTPTRLDTSVVKRAGAPVPVEIALAPVTPVIGAGELTRGLVCVAEDVRERREAERLLIEARDRAQASDKGKSEFLATMSHELRTPLNAIIGYSQMLQENIDDREGSLEDLRKIESAGSDLLRTVDRVLELANAESGKTVLTLEPFPVATLIAEVRSEAEPLAGRRGNLFQVHVSPDAGTMVADRAKIRQVLTNLVSNANKFTERGTVSLKVNRLDVGGAAWLSFEVNDTGIGMSDDQMTTLFTPFDANAGRRYGGTGLGLALASRFCRMMSGSIDVSSAPGRGSCFTVKLPVVVPSVDLAA